MEERSIALETGSQYVNALGSGSWGGGDKRIWRVIFAEIPDGDPALDWTTPERGLYLRAFDAWSHVAQVDVVVTSDGDSADLVEWQTTDFHWLGSNPTPSADHEGPGKPSVGFFNTSKPWWNPADLVVGGVVHNVMVHEIGHALGLNHPHPTSGQDAINFPGVDNEDDRGDFELNQSIFTVMSYIDPPRPGDRSGDLATPMAWDIAAIQATCGARTVANPLDDTYVLNDFDGVGTFYSCIWDTGGIDRIVYGGGRNASIDLRPASLRPITGGGGYLASVDGIKGGFTIAGDFMRVLPNVNGTEGVIIENAASGAGNAVRQRRGQLPERRRRLGPATGQARRRPARGRPRRRRPGRRARHRHCRLYQCQAAGRGRPPRLEPQPGRRRWRQLPSGVEKVRGSRIGGDILAGTIFTEDLFGDAGDDVLIGRDGNDVLRGWSNRDRLDGGFGSDQLLGGTGIDLATYESAPAGVVADLLSPTLNTGDAAGDTYSSVENLEGSDFPDTLRGNAGPTRSRAATASSDGAARRTGSGGCMMRPTAIPAICAPIRAPCSSRLARCRSATCRPSGTPSSFPWPSAILASKAWSVLSNSRRSPG